MKHLIQCLLVVLLAIGFAACSKPALQYPATQFKLKPKADKANKTIKVSGTAVRLENDGWKLLLIFDTLTESDVQNISIVNEQYNLDSREEGGKFIVAWEVPKERWKDKKTFVVSLALSGDSNNKNALITTKHPTSEEKLTPLGHVVGVVVGTAYLVVMIGSPMLISSIFL
jgi:hypothetical protein